MNNSGGIPQFGIALGALGIVLAFLGLFPDVTGIPTGQGLGVVQFVAIIIGFSLLMFGAIMYVKWTFYLGVQPNLIQAIGLRLAMTGIVFSGIAGFADFLGFGSHNLVLASEGLLGPIQALGVLGGFFIAALGVMIYAATGKPWDMPEVRDENGNPPPDSVTH